MVRLCQQFKIDELYRLVHQRGGHRVFAMLHEVHGYLDESGIHAGAEVCVIAGYFGGRCGMRELEANWRTVMDSHNFRMSGFHAKDLLKKRDAEPMLRMLSEAIAEARKVKPIAQAIIVPDFARLSISERRFLTGGSVSYTTKNFISSGCHSKAYFVPFQRAIRKICDYAPSNGKAHFHLGLDTEFAQFAAALVSQMQAEPHDKINSTWNSRRRLGNITFPRATETPQLQAADLLAHLTYLQLLKSREANCHVEPNAMLRNCLANARSRHDLEFQDAATLRESLKMAESIIPGWRAAAK